ncbi:MAG TPA: Cof-type HAD-IIB family hydrolase [Acidimicrobiales bacterium]|nr:Cof-type HAD-IIB family hydrolase [Acidimicrobiales bacterium]
MSTRVRLVLSDVDGTLVTPDKTLTPQSRRAVEKLGEAGILFAVTSARPPQGLAMLVEPLRLRTPLGALNGALIVDNDLRVLEERTIGDDVVAPLVDVMLAQRLSVWVYQGSRWFVLDENGPHVEHEARVCQFRPTTLSDFSSVEGGVTKLVGVSDDASACASASAAIEATFASRVSATRSQPYFLDITHPDATKGEVVRFLAKSYGVALEEIATIGDMHNDVSMFAESGLSIAMGNADDAVKAAASRVTTSNEDEGFAHAMERFILDS